MSKWTVARMFVRSAIAKSDRIARPGPTRQTAKQTNPLGATA
jgi:hypothetical protein